MKLMAKQTQSTRFPRFSTRVCCQMSVAGRLVLSRSFIGKKKEDESNGDLVLLA